MKNKYIKLLVVIGALLVLSLVTSASYAYFVAYVNGNESASANVIETGNMEITFEDGSGKIWAKDFIPGSQVTKTFSVKNTGDVYAYYDLYFDETINYFYHTDTLVYELISDNGLNVAQTPCPTGTDSIGLNIGIDVGQTHNYTLKISFLNTDYNQDMDKGTVFYTVISLLKEQDMQREITTALQTMIPKEDGTFSMSTPLIKDDDWNTIDEFYNDKKVDAYLKHEVYSSYLYTNDYYKLLLLSDVTNYFSSVDMCSQYGISCIEKDGKIYYFIMNMYFTSERTCQFALNSISDPDGYYECVEEHSDEIKKIRNDLFDFKTLSSKLCINNGTELCFDPHEYFDGSAADEYSRTNNRYASEYQQFIDEISTFGTFNCTLPANIVSGIVCNYEDKFTIEYNSGNITTTRKIDDHNNEYLTIKTDGTYDQQVDNIPVKQ
ncbi:MAG: hypothetical protein E7159_02810 [Firmicutes bacterium]|nr:hypothetical protein [Bacillota bacterium]